MTDRLGWRLKVGVLVPAFNASLQPELEALRPRGVTNHVARIAADDGPLTSDAEQAELVRTVEDNVLPALATLLPVAPGVVVHGVSIPTFWNGPDGARRTAAALEAFAGVPVSISSLALEAALAVIPAPGPLGIVTPYQPVGDAAVRSYFEVLGHTVASLVSLRRPGHQAIAHATAVELEEAFDAVCAAGARTVVQVGTNVAAADLVAGAEERLGVPVIAINVALYWHALRLAGIPDRLSGYGQIFEGESAR